ncbi:hypothetical protein GJ496_008544 [Pomphorhynchus laevis]|nr:hypothetical protein GJ496_008544 [Pomphorhynchus laevis]
MAAAATTVFDNDRQSDQMLPESSPLIMTKSKSEQYVRNRKRRVIQSNGSIQVTSAESDGSTDRSTMPSSVTSHFAESQQIFSLITMRIRKNARNIILRILLCVLMISLFSAVIYLGPLAITTCILFIQIMCFHEVISIGEVACKSHNIPFSRILSWYFLATSDFYLFGESIVEYFGRLLAKNDFGRSFLNYNLLISYSMYIAGFVTFVINLKKKLYTKQFIMFGITHITLLMIVLQSNLMIKSMMNGIVWFLLPSLLIICNDTFAYGFGFFIGRTPLIKISPKKTWEGFIGGAISTVLFGFIVSSIFARYKYMICPVHYYEGDDSFTNHCEPAEIFSYKVYQIKMPILLHKVFTDKIQVKLLPFQLHSIVLSLFASLISPFSGFFASGYKRIFKMKDFSDVIPGHGGFMDRFDCQGSMGTFTYVWISTFVRAPTPQKLFKAFLHLSNESKIEFLRLINSVKM